MDPDNRRPVDFSKRIKLLEELKQREKENRPAFIQDLLSRWVDGKIKLYVTYKGLSFRRSQRSLFEGGNYLPIDALTESESMSAPSPGRKARPGLWWQCRA